MIGVGEHSPNGGSTSCLETERARRSTHSAKPDRRIGVALGRFGTVIGRGLRQVLGEDRRLHVVGDDLDSTALETAAAELTVRVAMVSDAGVAGRAVLGRLWAAQPDLGVVVLAVQPTSMYSQLLAHGITACLSLDASAADILDAVHLAADGRRSAALAPVGLATPVFAPWARFARVESLTRREREVLGLLSRGKSNAEIALQLHIGVETARTHVAHILGKLGVSTRRDLIDIPLPAELGRPR